MSSFLRLNIFPGLLVILSLCFQPCRGQTVTQANRASCDRHHESERCQQLVKEFYADHGLLAVPPSSPLDFPPGDTRAFADKMAPKALLAQLRSELKAQTELAAQAALQTISTTAAVTQLGGPPNGSGSTNLVTKPTTTDFLSMAAESGAFTDTLNGNAVTVQVNALGMTKYIANQPIFARIASRIADLLQPLNFAVSMNVAQSGSSTPSTSGSANSSTPPSISSVVLPANNASFSSFGITYNFYHPYNPQDKNFLQNWENAVASNQKALDSAGSAIAVAMNGLLTATVIQELSGNLAGPLSIWHTAGAAAEKNVNFDAFVSAFSDYDNTFCNFILSRPDAPTNVLALSDALDAFSAATYTVLSQARGTPLATISYLYSAPVQQPATHAATIAVSELFRGGHRIKDASGKDTGERDTTRTFLSGAQLTGNFTASMYSDLPAGAKYGRFRDVQVSAEFDKPFGGTIAAPRGTLSFAGYGQYQYDPTVLNITEGNIVPGTEIPLPGNAQVLLGTAGWIGVVQGKVSFNLSKGLTIPIAVKWSNKTDLLNANDVRGQFGLSYDLSALSNLITNKQ